MGLLIVSWNVAGLATTVQRIEDAYKKDAKKSTSLDYFFNRHKADIVCIQEHKISQTQLSNRIEPHKCSTPNGYESFWSPTTSSGFNGVVTYARKGLTRSANARPLGIPELDKQGRCIFTDHGAFVIFNVYLPCNSGHSTRDKMRFLNALSNAMQRATKPTILLGDLNITHQPLDKCWMDRLVLVESILDEKKSSLPSWKSDVIEAWPIIEKTLSTAEPMETQTTNPTTGVKFQKFRLQCILPDKKKVFLGKFELKPEHCLWPYNISESYYECPETGESILACGAKTISIGVLSELMKKIANKDWKEYLQRQIAASTEDIAGVCPHHPARKWLTKSVADKMVDVFRYFYPKAEGRFTCWCQNTNRRYENEGARIDYIWVDRSLLSRVKKGGGLRGLSEENDRIHPESEDAALEAATCQGRYKPVSYHGEGIADVSRETLDLQFGPPHTGMIYTPPSFSDHIAVSVFLDLDLDQKQVLQGDDKETKRSQPHKLQKSISDFFKVPNKNNNNARNNDLKKKRSSISTKNHQNRKKTKNILHHFGVKQK